MPRHCWCEPCDPVRRVLRRRRRAGPAARSDRDARALPADARRAGRRLGRGGVPGHVPVGAVRPPRPGVRRVLRVRRLGGGGTGGRRRRGSVGARVGDGRRGRRLTARTGPPRPVVRGATVQVDVVVDSAADRDLVVTLDGVEVPVPAGGAGLRTVDATGPMTVTCGTARCTVDAVVPAAAATLRLISPHGARWSVTDATDGAWFAEGVPAKWDADDRPFFHTDPGTWSCGSPPVRCTSSPPAGSSSRGRSSTSSRQRGETVTVEYDPVRRFDPAADGWYGADLHVHLNYSGDHVLEPADAVRMQRGEGLALMHLAAGNLGGALVYDLELLEATAGTTCGRRRARPLGAGVPQPAARSRARPGPDRRPGAAVHRRRGHRPPLGLAAEQRGLRADARARRGHHLRTPRVRAGRRPRRPVPPVPHGRGPRAGGRRRARSGRRRRARLLLRRPRRARALPPPALVRPAAGGASRAPTPSCRSPAARPRRRTRRAGAGCTRSSATRR